MHRDSICINATSVNGKQLSAHFLPHMGMNFISYQKDGLEVIDQSTKPLFDERFAGLGAMIGPHFHHRKPESIPKIENPSLFPHIAIIEKKGSSDPFSHGIGRYAPWQVENQGPNFISASLNGSDKWKGIALKDIEGQDFKMGYNARMTPGGLEIELSVASELESVVGLHTYYTLANGKGTIKAKVQDQFRDKEGIKGVASTWNYDDMNKMLIYETDREIDSGFFPFPSPLQGKMELETKTHRVIVQYYSENQENSFQIWHPRDASFICMEPLSAKDPRNPRLKASSVKILISIL